VVAESSRRWNAVDDIAERSEADDEKCLHGIVSRRIRLNRSRVE
jgi:hypothetical protein